MTQLRKQTGDSQSPAPPATPRLAAATVAPLDSLLNPDLFKALCDPTRAGIALCLCKCSRPCSVSEIAECCSVDLSVVSRHLAFLERHGVVDCTRQGRAVFYRVRYQPLIQSFRALADAIETCYRACGQSPCDPGSTCCAGGDCAQPQEPVRASARSTARPRTKTNGGPRAR